MKVIQGDVVYARSRKISRLAALETKTIFRRNDMIYMKINRDVLPPDSLWRQVAALSLDDGIVVQFDGDTEVEVERESRLEAWF